MDRFATTSTLPHHNCVALLLLLTIACDPDVRVCFMSDGGLPFFHVRAATTVVCVVYRPQHHPLPLPTCFAQSCRRRYEFASGWPAIGASISERRLRTSQAFARLLHASAAWLGNVAHASCIANHCIWCAPCSRPSSHLCSPHRQHAANAAHTQQLVRVCPISSNDSCTQRRSLEVNRQSRAACACRAHAWGNRHRLLFQRVLC